MEARSEHQKTKMYGTIYSFTTSLGVGLLMMVLFWILHYRGGFAWHSNPAQQFYWHPFLLVLGMVFLYSQSILVYRTGRSVQKKKLKLLHGALHLLAFILSVIGLKAVFDFHNLSATPIANLYTMHSWIGLITVIIFALQFFFGFISFLYPGISMTLRRAIMPIHIVVGTLTFVLAIICVLTGLTEKALWTLKNYADFPAEGFVYNFIGLITIFYGLLVLYLVGEASYKRSPLPEDEVVLSMSD
ncbi:lysosomal membrane ascorbate-dependent ferrireductase CYB561A3 isoform X2 [Cylas formicarius]|nr:lysosomal membrane ascorbate-dependent ferrireductase CYB561A3 isoform X2 [Cylas formicarius]